MLDEYRRRTHVIGAIRAVEKMLLELLPLAGIKLVEQISFGCVLPDGFFVVHQKIPLTT
jgi:hypothetical protein